MRRVMGHAAHGHAGVWRAEVVLLVRLCVLRRHARRKTVVHVGIVRTCGRVSSAILRHHLARLRWHGRMTEARAVGLHGVRVVGWRLLLGWLMLVSHGLRRVATRTVVLLWRVLLRVRVSIGLVRTRGVAVRWRTVLAIVRRPMLRHARVRTVSRLVMRGSRVRRR